ncbi:N-acetyltransferase family protein [Spirillospora sp. CA-142024]|uniref:GNAT family N-acetyltransferase n=1 Tax=Spirillospora sp. CA-142024 TaxID=3240036 RepID=UPI003D91993E
MTGRFEMVTVDPAAPPEWVGTWAAELARTRQRNRGRAPGDPAVVRDRLLTALATRPAAVARTGQGTAYCAVGRADHPLTGRPEVTLSRFVGTASDAVDVLLDGLAGEDALARCTVEVEARRDCRHGGLADHGFTESVLTARHGTGNADRAPAAPGHPELRLRRARADDADFVADCLTTALRRGLSGEAPAVDLDAFARERYALTGDGVLCLVGEVDGRRACHGFGHARTDRYGIDRVLYLVDVFVLPEHHGNGLSTATTAALLAAADEAGYGVVESDVVLGPVSDRLRTGLRAAGWTEDRVRWSRGW